MNKLQIIEYIFGNDCFTPCVRCYGDSTYYSARAKLKYFNSWSATSVAWYMHLAKKHGAEVGIDFDRKEFTITFEY
jgi:hypothetical protein